MKRLLIFPDVHAPFHDKRAWNVFLKAGQHFKPDILVGLGDFADCYTTSRHPKDPNRGRDFDKEMRGVEEPLDELDDIKPADSRICMGNHEFNVERYLAERAPELFNCFSVAQRLCLQERGYKITPYKQFGRVGKLVYTHEVGFCGANAHVQGADAVGTNLVTGHNHRLSVSYRSTILGKPHVAVSAGCLADKKAAEYMHRARTRDWQHGFVIGRMHPNGTVYLTPVPIVNNACVLEGKFIR